MHCCTATGHLWEVDADCVVVPVFVTDLRQLPAPLSRLECIQVHAMARFLPHQQHEVAVVNEHGKVMSVHTWQTSHSRLENIGSRSDM